MELPGSLSLEVRAVWSGKHVYYTIAKNPRKIPRSYEEYMFNSGKNNFFGKKSAG